MASTFVNGPRLAYDHEKISTLTSSTGLTATKYAVGNTFAAGETNTFDKVRRAEEVFISVETADIRYTIDGTTPTVTAGTGIGHLATSGSTITIVGFEAISKFRAINAVASSGSAIQATYFR